MKKIHIFDMDGTLIRSMPHIVGSILYVLEEDHISYGPELIDTLIPLDIITYVMKITDYKGRVKYKIYQNLPLTKNPFYDGDFATNRTVERYGHSEWIRAEYAIDKDKIENQTKTEPNGQEKERRPETTEDAHHL